MRALIIYYSLDGSTRFIAENLAAAVGADIEELRPKLHLPSGNFAKHFWGGRMVIFKEKPEIEPLSHNIAEYDLIVIGTPVWAFNFTPPLRTFFERYKFSGKRVAIFCCCDGMPGKTVGNIKINLPGNEFTGELVLVKTAKNLEANKGKAEAWIRQLTSTLN